MAQKTNLNAAPYFDDFDASKNYHKILFRPGYAVQARELTQLQSALQHQIEAHGSHIFREGAMVVPGQGTTQRYYSLKLASTFNGTQVDPSQYYNVDNPTTITGATTGVTAKVIGFKIATTTDQPLLYLSYTNSGTDFETSVFADGENLNANTAISHSTTSFAAAAASSTTYTSQYSVAAASSTAELASADGPAARTGLAYSIESGIYYIRGFFVNNLEEILVINNYAETFTGTVGFAVNEIISTPEVQTDLLDNSTGSSNYAAKGAHRLSISVALSTISDSTDTTNFIALVDYKNGKSSGIGRRTPYAALADEMARRTNDESGNYTVRPFEFFAEESVDVSVGKANLLGRYTAGDTTDDGNIASSDYLAISVSPGKAYIRGFEIEKTQSTIVDVLKARETESVNASISTFDTGNFALVKNVYGTPDITGVTGETTAFKTVQFYDTANTTRGSANGNLIGVGRTRGMEFSSGVAGASATNTAALYKLYLFDIRPFTKLTLSGTPSPTLIASHANGGVLITGVTSGATGLVFEDGTSGTSVNLTSVVGTFIAGEELKASDSAEGDGGTIENSGNTDLTLVSFITNTVADFRQVYMDDDAGDSGQDFTADFVTEILRTTFADFAVEQDRTASFSLEIATKTSGKLIQEGFNSEGAKLKDTEKNRAIFKLPNSTVKTLLTETNAGLSDTQYTIRRQFVGTTNSSGVVTFTAGSNETFASHSEKDYTLSILTAGGTGAQGDLVSLSGKIAGAGTSTLTVTDSTILGNAAKVKIVATILKTSVIQKSKTTKLMKQLKVTSGTTHAYGTRPSDVTISLGRGDVFNLIAVFDSEGASTDALAPEFTLTNQAGTFTRGEKITGATSGATARIIDISSPMSHIRSTSIIFRAGEVITGESSGASATIGTLTDGSINITNTYLFDDGQRDNFYDIARIVRKSSSPAPTGRLLIVYDYLEHGSGDMLTVDSYVDIGNQMDYEDIPSYTATKVDPDSPAPGGQFPLRDSYDFRSKVEDIAGTSSAIDVIDEITGNSFDFYSRQYDGTGASISDFGKPGSTIQSDLEYFIGKKAAIVLDDRGDISVIEGSSSDTPRKPDIPSDVMKLADLSIPPFTFKPESILIGRTKNQRFTMKDIGKMSNRLSNVEKMTALNLLEKDALAFEVTDANGLNRFKSGIVVDNFQGHKVGDAFHKDYKNSMDFSKGVLRSIHRTKSVDLEESATTDSARTSAGYQKTGDLITLPYTEVVLTEQPYASTVERVAPFKSATWKGVLSIDPSQDNWFETEIAPRITINREGNYDAVVSSIGNNMGTVWNSWQTTWSGVVQRDDGLPAQTGAVSGSGGGGGGSYIFEATGEDDHWEWVDEATGTVVAGPNGGLFEEDEQPECLTYDMKVMLSTNILVNVNNLKVGDNIMTINGNTIIEELITEHMRKGYYVINNELEITNDHPIFVNASMWKRTEDLLIGDVINNVRIDTMEYISKITPTVSIVTEFDSYNVYCNENLYTVHGRYRFIKEQEYRSAA